MNYKQLEQKIIKSYTEGTTLDEAERLAAEFLSAQIAVSEELKKSSLKARLLKNSSKAVRASILYEAATTPEKKPSDSILQALVDKNSDVQATQTSFDEAEEDANELDRMYNIFRDAHVYYRGIARAKFE
jgi:hypothetical protein